MAASLTILAIISCSFAHLVLHVAGVVAGLELECVEGDGGAHAAAITGVATAGGEHHAAVAGAHAHLSETKRIY